MAEFRKVDGKQYNLNSGEAGVELYGRTTGNVNVALQVTSDGKLVIDATSLHASLDTRYVQGASFPLTTGGVLFSNSSGQAAQDATNFFWDDTNNFLGIGTSSPSTPLDIAGYATELTLLSLTQTPTPLTGTFQLVLSQIFANAGAASASNYIAYRTLAQVTDSQAYSGVICGARIEANVNASATPNITGLVQDTGLIGAVVTVEPNNATVGRVVGIDVNAHNIDDGDVTTLTGLNFINLNIIGTGTIENLIGIHLPQMDDGGAQVTNYFDMDFGSTNPHIRKAGTSGSFIFIDAGSNTLATITDSGTVGRFGVTGSIDLVDGVQLRQGTGTDVQMFYSGTSWQFQVLQATNSIVFNESAVDTDFRIEGSGDVNLFYLNAGTNNVGIGMNNPAQKLDVTGDFKAGAASGAQGSRIIGRGEHTSAPAGSLATGEWELSIFDNGVTPVFRIRYNDAGSVKTGDVALA